MHVRVMVNREIVEIMNGIINRADREKMQGNKIRCSGNVTYTITLQANILRKRMQLR